jgi:hypothetical protein
MRLSHVPALVSRASILLAVATQLSGSQSAPHVGVIDGIVTDSALAPLGEATISLLGTNVRVVTGSNGRFRVRDVKAGAYILLVRHIGYEAASVRMQLAPGDTASPSVALQRASTKLDAVSITGQRLTPAMQEFETRRKLGEGQFMTQAQIEKRNVVALSDLLATFKGIVVHPGGGPIYPLRSTGNHDNRHCQLQVFLDGIKMPDLPDINEYALPKEVAGIELYLGPATIPLQYKSAGSGGFCGVILLWTRVES